MFLKKVSLWVALLLIAIPLAYASGLLTPIKPNDLSQLSKGRYNLMSMIIGCEMDNKCMQITLTEIIKKDPHPVYEQYLATLNDHKDDIEYEQMHCNNSEIRAYRREITSCLSEMLKKVDPKVGLTFDQKNKVDKQMNDCIKMKMEAFAKRGNLYAQAALMNYSLKNKDIPNFEKWYNAIQAQNTRLEYSTYRSCQQPVQMFDLLIPQFPTFSQQDK